MSVRLSTRSPAPGAPSAALIGFGYYTAAIADLCAEAGVPVAFATDFTEGSGTDPYGGAHTLAVRGVPVVSAAEFDERVQRTEDVTLVAGQIECPPDTPADADPYVRAAAWVRRRTGRDTLHPAALLDRVPPAPCPDRYAVFGYPGAGNVLTQAFVAALFAGDERPAPLAWSLRAALAEHYFQSTAARLRAALARFHVTGLDFVEHEFGRLRVVARFDGGRMAVAEGIPSLRHHGIRQYVTHARPTPAAVDFFTAAGGPCVIAARHPCETLLSFAGKIGRPAQAVLDRPNFIFGAMLGMADWYGQATRNRHRTFVARYEALAGRDTGHLRALAAFLGRPLSAADADALFDRFLNRNLPASVPNHFHRGGTDKWRRQLTPEHLRSVRRWLPDSAFTELGYPVPTTADLLPAEPTAGERSPDPLDTLLLNTQRFQRVHGPYQLAYTAADQELSEALRATLRDGQLLTLLAAGGFPNDPPFPPPVELPAAA